MVNDLIFGNSINDKINGPKAEQNIILPAFAGLLHGIAVCGIYQHPSMNRESIPLYFNGLHTCLYKYQ